MPAEAGDDVLTIKELERAFLVSTSSVWRMVLEKRGPMATYSSSRSTSSRITIDSGDYTAQH